MNESLYIAATGLRAQQLAVDTVSNNLANVNTPGFKKSRVNFDEAMVRELQQGGLGPGVMAGPLRSGAGVAVLGSSRVFSAGELKKTDDAMNIAIKGEGFLEVLMPDGSSAYTRVGRLKVNDDGLLSTTDGLPLAGAVRVPADAKSIVISSGGVVRALGSAGRSDEDIGTLELVQFPNPQALQAQGQGLFQATQAAGQPSRSVPGEAGAGTLAQGFLESSNVALVDEMVNLMIAQRAYEMSAKVIQASDEMLAISNNLRR